MNNLGKAGAILSIIGSAIMCIWSLIVFSSAGLLSFIPIFGSAIIILGVIVFAIAVINIVLSSLALAGKENLVVVAGVFSVVSVLFAWIAWIFPAIVFIIGAVFLFCGKRKENIDDAEIMSDRKVSSVFGTDVES